MKEIPESLKLEFTMAMRELDAEVKKQKREKEILDKLFSKEKK